MITSWLDSGTESGTAQTLRSTSWARFRFQGFFNIYSSIYGHEYDLLSLDSCFAIDISWFLKWNTGSRGSTN